MGMKRPWGIHCEAYALAHRGAVWQDAGGGFWITTSWVIAVATGRGRLLKPVFRRKGGVFYRTQIDGKRMDRSLQSLIKSAKSAPNPRTELKSVGNRCPQ